MRSITYAYLGPEADAGKFAKKGTASDITLFNGKKGDAHLNLVHATRYPDKLTSLLIALDLADEIVLHPTALDRTLGEMVVGAELFGRTRGFLRATDPGTLEQARALLSKTALRDLTISTEPDGVFREALFERAASESSGPTAVPIDHSFAVKGVGTVALALVRSGSIGAHASLQAYPTTRIVEVRSLQVHDVDVETAGRRSRVGLALKNVEPEHVPRGTVLAPAGSLQILPPNVPVKAEILASPFSKWAPKTGAVLHLFHCLQDIVARVETLGQASKERVPCELRFEAPVAWVPDQPAVLVDLDQKAQRFVGRVKVLT